MLCGVYTYANVYILRQTKTPSGLRAPLWKENFLHFFIIYAGLKFRRVRFLRKVWPFHFFSVLIRIITFPNKPTYVCAYVNFGLLSMQYFPIGNEHCIIHMIKYIHVISYSILLYIYKDSMRTTYLDMNSNYEHSCFSSFEENNYFFSIYICTCEYTEID